MAAEELQRQLRQDRANMEQLGMFMQVMSQLSLPFEHLPLEDMPLASLIPYPPQGEAFHILLSLTYHCTLNAYRSCSVDGLTWEHIGEQASVGV
jgi:hypothetical protein